MNFKNYNRQEKFSIRKYKSLGAASAVIGALFLAGGAASAHESQPIAETNVQPPLSAEEASPKAATDEASSSSSDQPTSETRSRRGKRDVSETEVHPTHGRLIEKDPSIDEGALYEDGTYVIKKIGNKNLDINNPNQAIGSMFYSDPSKLSKIKKIEVEGRIVANRFDIVASDNDLSLTSMDLTGLTLSDRSNIPLLTYGDNRLENITFDPDFSLSKIKSVNRMFDIATKLRLSNEQVSQLLRNVAFESNASYNGPIFRKVGVERLDLSSFDNSKWNINSYQPHRFSDDDGAKTLATKSVFKDLIGLKEIVFGDKFDFNNYGRKNTPDAFLDTDLSGVERVTLLGATEREDASKFFADWLRDVQKLNDANKRGLYRDGGYLESVSETLDFINSGNTNHRGAVSGVYTLGPIPTARPEKPADKVVTETLEPTVEYASDDTKDRGYENRVEGERGSKTITTTYEWDDATNSYKEKVLEPVIKSAGKTIVTLGTKPTTEVTYQDFNTRYVADPTRTAGEKFTETEGVRGTITTTTTYSVNAETGVVTSTKGQPQVVAPTDKVVKVGTKSTTQTAVIPKGTVYQEDRDAEFESRTTLSEGHDGSTTTTTTYTLNEQNGEVIPKIETVTIEKEDKIVKVGNRKTEVTFDAFTTVYEPEESMPFNEKREIYAGHAGEITNLIDYDVNPSTGELSNPRNVGGSRTVTLPREIAVGNKQVVTESIPATNRYVGNEEKERGYSNLIQQGRDGSRTITTIYTVNAKTGDLSNPTSTEASTPMTRNVYEVGAKPTITYLKEQNKIVKHTTRVKVDEDTGGLTNVTSTETISEDGAKDKIVTEELASPARYEKDDSRDRGNEDIRTEGKSGTKATTTTYEVNPDTGDLIPTVHEPVITPATETVVKVAAKDKVTYKKQGDNVVKTTTVYTVNPENGNITEASTDEVTQPNGVKDKVVTEDIEPKVVYEKDDTREKGSDNITILGRKGSKVTTATYTVNETTGKIEEHVGEPVITPATETVVKVAAKDKVETIRKDGETLERTTRYTVDPVTGEVSSKSSDRLIASSVSDGEGNVIQTPTVEIPEYTRPIASSVSDGDGNVIPAPTVEIPEFNGGVTPNNAPIHEIPEFKGGVVPIDAPVQEIPALEAPVTDHQKDVPSIETRQDDKINASKDAAKSKGDIIKKLPNTGHSSDSAGVAGLMLAGLAYYLKRKRS